MNEIITFDNVTYSYPGGTENPPPSADSTPFGEGGGIPAVNGVTLSIHQGETVAILGHNGSGKSTLIKMTNGMIVPDSGTAAVCGMDSRDETQILSIRQTVGLVFQNPDNQIVATVVEEDVAFALENLGVPPPEIRERVDDALRTVGMYDFREHAPHRLSGGQKQRVAIAGVLAMRPKVLALDEPTAMLDPKGRREVMDTLFRLNRERGVTVVMVTHHMNEAAMCSRVVVMDRGKVKLDGTPENVFTRYDELRAFGLTVPQTVEFARSLGIKAAPLTIDDCADVIYSYLSGKCM